MNGRSRSSEAGRGGIIGRLQQFIADIFRKRFYFVLDCSGLKSHGRYVQEQMSGPSMMDRLANYFR